MVLDTFCNNRRPGLWVPAPRAQLRTRQRRHRMMSHHLSHPPIIDPVLSRQHAPRTDRLDHEVAREGGGTPEVIDSPLLPRGPLHPRSRVQLHKRVRTRAYRSSGEHPTFPAQWFYGLYAISPVSRALLPPSSLRTCFSRTWRQLRAPEPRDFAVRVSHARQAQLPHPPHPTARS